MTQARWACWLATTGAAVLLPTMAGGALSTRQIAELMATDAAALDQLGHAVAASGDLAVVGAPFDDDNGTDSGAAYLFARNQGGEDAWGQVAKLTPLDGAAGDGFGHAVGISGDTVVVGAPHDDDACPPDGFCDSGSAYVFVRNQGGADAWGQIVKLSAADMAGGDEFGVSVAIDNDTIVVGARGSAHAGAGSGAAYVFARNQGGSGAWGQVEKLTASDAAGGDEFGTAVGISRDLIVVGAPRGDGLFSDSGSLYLFERNQGGVENWGELMELSAADGSTGDEFGRAVAIDNDTVVTGAPMDDDAGAASGSAYVFERNQSGADLWEQVQKLAATDAAPGDELGWAVAIAIDTVVVGAHRADLMVDAGAAYVFGRNWGGADAWGEVQKVRASDTAAEDRFGHAVALSSSTLLVGSPLTDDAGDRSGSAYVFSRGGALWPQVEKPVALDAAAGDNFGRAVAVGGDTVVVGSPFDDDDGDFSGSAYVYTRNQGGAAAWDQVMKLTGSDATTGDSFGDAVAIHGDRVVVGARNADTVVPGGGAAYLFERNQGGADNWGEVRVLAPAELVGSDNFGASVAIWGDTVAVGDPHQDDACVANSSCNSGAVFVFVRNQGGADNWGEIARLTASDAAEGDEFGTSVAIWGDTIVVGSPLDDDACGSVPCDSGSAYVFARNQGGADSWGEVRKLVADDDHFGDVFGGSVSIDGATVAAGAPLADSASGAVYIFERNEGGSDQWGQRAKLTVANSLVGLGGSVAISGDRVVAGAEFDDSSCPGMTDTNCGVAYVFERNRDGTDVWGEAASVAASDPESNDRFSRAVALSGPTMVIGSYLDDDACLGNPTCDSGSAYVFRLRAPEVELSINKDDGLVEVERGADLTYTIDVVNSGPESADGVLVYDDLDASQFVLGRTGWICAPGSGSDPATGCPTSGNAADLAAGVSVDIASGDSVRFTLVTQVANPASGPIVNVAQIGAPGYLDRDPADDVATDSDHLLIPGACGHFEDRLVAHQVIATETAITACNSITLGPDLEITGGLLARAGAQIRVGSGFVVMNGGELILMIDGSLAP